jgi:hypothetical protein
MCPCSSSRAGEALRRRSSLYSSLPTSFTRSQTQNPAQTRVSSTPTAITSAGAIEAQLSFSSGRAATAVIISEGADSTPSIAERPGRVCREAPNPSREANVPRSRLLTSQKRSPRRMHPKKVSPGCLAQQSSVRSGRRGQASGPACERSARVLCDLSGSDHATRTILAPVAVPTVVIASGAKQSRDRDVGRFAAPLVWPLAGCGACAAVADRQSAELLQPARSLDCFASLAMTADVSARVQFELPPRVMVTVCAAPRRPRRTSLRWRQIPLRASSRGRSASASGRRDRGG